MKKTLLSFALMLAAMTVSAEEYSDGDINYEVDFDTKTATVIWKRSWEEMGPFGVHHNNYEGDIVIPETVGEYTVVAIGSQAFANLYNDRVSISSISIPKTVKKIGSDAFNGCYNLKTFTIPATVEEIGGSVFSNSAIETLTIEDGDTPLTIGWRGYSTGSVLTGIDACRTVYVGRDITCNFRIGTNSTFSFCENVTDITYGPLVTKINVNECWRSKSIQHVTFLCPELQEIPDNAFAESEGLLSVTLPAKVGRVGNYAFADCPKLSELKVPATLTSIGKGAFSNCKGLKELTIPATTTEVGESAFSGTGLTQLTFSDSQTPLPVGRWFISGIADGSLTLYLGRDLDLSNGLYGGGPLADYSAIGELTYGKYITVIHVKEAYRNKGLKTVYIKSDYITEIPDGAFQECSNLEEVWTSCWMDDSLSATESRITAIGNSAFSDCKKLRAYFIKYQGMPVMQMSGAATTIGDYAFYNTALDQFLVQAPVTYMGQTVFGNSQVKKIILESTTEPLKMHKRCLNGLNGADLRIRRPLDIDEGMFRDGGGIARVTYSQEANKVDSWKYNKGLKYVYVSSKNITEIPKEAFYECNALDSVKVNVEKIGNSAFEYCRNMQKAVFYEGLKTIGNNAFQNAMLTKVELPSTVDSIGTRAFSCKTVDVLDSIVCLGTVPPVCTGWPFYEKNKFLQTDVILIVPGAGLAAYKQAEYWKDFLNIEGEGEVPPETTTVTLATAPSSNKGYATFYDSQNNYEMPTGLAAYVLSETNSGTSNFVWQKLNGSVIPKGVAVELTATVSTASTTFTLTATAEATPYTGTNYLLGSDVATTTAASVDSYFYKLCFGAKGTTLENWLGWFPGDRNFSAFQIDGHRAWIALPKSSATRAPYIPNPEETSGIEAAADGVQETSNPWYDLQGRSLTKPVAPGIYVRDGRKVIIK